MGISAHATDSEVNLKISQHRSRQLILYQIQFICNSVCLCRETLKNTTYSSLYFYLNLPCYTKFVIFVSSETCSEELLHNVLTLVGKISQF